MVFNFAFKSFKQNASCVEKTEKRHLTTYFIVLSKQSRLQDGNNVHVIGYQMFVKGCSVSPQKKV